MSLADSKESFIWISTLIAIVVAGIQTILVAEALLKNGASVVLEPSSYLLYDELGITPYDIGDKFIKYFDKGKNPIFELDYKGNHFEYVFYDNKLPFADRYELLMNGKRVEDPKIAKEVFSIAVWNSNEIKSRILNLDVYELNEIKDDADHINSIISPFYTVVHTLKEYFDKTRTIKIFGTSLFDVITKDAKVYYFYLAISKLDPELFGWMSATENCISGINTITNDVNLVRTSEVVDPEKLKNDFIYASSAIDSYAEKFQSLSNEIDKIIKYSEDAKAVLSAYPQAKFIISAIDKVENTAKSIQSNIENYAERVSSQSAQIREIIRLAEAKEKEYFKGYMNGFAVPFLFGSVIMFTIVLIFFFTISFIISVEDKKYLLKKNVKLVVLGIFSFAVTYLVVQGAGQYQVQVDLINPEWKDANGLISFFKGNVDALYPQNVNYSTIMYLTLSWRITSCIFLWTFLFWSYIAITRGITKGFAIRSTKYIIATSLSFAFLHVCGYVLCYIFPAIFFSPLTLFLMISISLASPFMFVFNRVILHKIINVAIIVYIATTIVILISILSYISIGYPSNELRILFEDSLFGVLPFLLAITTLLLLYSGRLILPAVYFLYLFWDVTCLFTLPPHPSCNLAMILLPINFFCLIILWIVFSEKLSLSKKLKEFYKLNTMNKVEIILYLLYILIILITVPSFALSHFIIKTSLFLEKVLAPFVVLLILAPSVLLYFSSPIFSD